MAWFGSARVGRCRCKTEIMHVTERSRGLSNSVISRVIVGVTPLRVLITLLIIYLSHLGLQVSVFGIQAPIVLRCFKGYAPLVKGS